MLLLSNLWLAGGKLAFFLMQAADQAAGGAAAQTEDFSLWGMIQKMGWPARIVAIILAIMSMYSIAIMVERWLTYNAAKNQSRQFAPKVAQALREALGEHERQGKDGRNVLVRQFRQRLTRVNSLIAQCQMTTSCSSQESFSDQQIPAFFRQNGDNEKNHHEVMARRGT